MSKYRKALKKQINDFSKRIWERAYPQHELAKYKIFPNEQNPYFNVGLLTILKETLEGDEFLEKQLGIKKTQSLGSAIKVAAAEFGQIIAEAEKYNQLVKRKIEYEECNKKLRQDADSFEKSWNESFAEDEVSNIFSESNFTFDADRLNILKQKLQQDKTLDVTKKAGLTKALDELIATALDYNRGHARQQGLAKLKGAFENFFAKLDRDSEIDINARIFPAGNPYDFEDLEATPFFDIDSLEELQKKLETNKDLKALNTELDFLIEKAFEYNQLYAAQEADSELQKIANKIAYEIYSNEHNRYEFKNISLASFLKALSLYQFIPRATFNYEDKQSFYGNKHSGLIPLMTDVKLATSADSTVGWQRRSNLQQISSVVDIIDVQIKRWHEFSKTIDKSYSSQNVSAKKATSWASLPSLSSVKLAYDGLLTRINALAQKLPNFPPAAAAEELQPLKPKAELSLEERAKLNNKLLTAASEGLYDTVDWALESGADVNARDTHGDTSLIFACYHGHLNIVERLLKEKYIDVNAKGNNDDNALICGG